MYFPGCSRSGRTQQSAPSVGVWSQGSVARNRRRAPGTVGGTARTRTLGAPSPPSLRAWAGSTARCGRERRREGGETGPVLGSRPPRAHSAAPESPSPRSSRRVPKAGRWGSLTLRVRGGGRAPWAGGGGRGLGGKARRRARRRAARALWRAEGHCPAPREGGRGRRGHCKAGWRGAREGGWDLNGSR